ncbi:uncharacterized protein LOC124922019 [Impatiens glandulifera]|uniref:uncharacterized protein LOC124922019 n=1 Tax=Impatiens glandulifera TaxID=253017 RepID=UPI001FB05A03|nr:uncharacterized protein LOC124922019 [Impatiens glandulifera]
MGKLNTQNQPDQTINHFSHPHPLNLTTNYYNNNNNPSSICSGCKLTIVSGQIYSCHFCKFFLHLKCSQKPKQIKHQFHPNHILTLLPVPIYPEGSFNCDACGKNGDGFSYHCQICNVDLHVLCASMPLSLTNSSHHHKLNLLFSPPYENAAFSCDVCKKPSSKTWLYRCGFCEFDCHLDCSNSSAQVSIQQMRTVPMVQAQTRMVQIQPMGIATPLFRPYNSMNPIMAAPLPPPPNPNLMQNYGYGVTNNRQNRMMGNGIVSNLFHGIVDGASQTAGQQLLQNLVGGGGGIDGGDFAANLFS